MPLDTRHVLEFVTKDGRLVVVVRVEGTDDLEVQVTPKGQHLGVGGDRTVSYDTVLRITADGAIKLGEA